MATVERLQIEQRFCLHAVPWDIYEQLRDEPENEHVRMTYDQGELEIMSPSKTHEQYVRLFARLIDAWTEEMNIDIASCGAMTCKREDLERGFEPDNCYYIANEAQMRSQQELDLTIHPPPDLAVEIDLSGRPRHKLALYAAFGVPEVWWFDGDRLHAFTLAANGSYEERPASRSLPGLLLTKIEEVLADFGTRSETALVRAFRAWVRTTL